MSDFQKNKDYFINIFLWVFCIVFGIKVIMNGRYIIGGGIIIMMIYLLYHTIKEFKEKKDYDRRIKRENKEMIEKIRKNKKE